MVRRAQDHGNATLGQFGEQRRGPGDAVGMDNDGDDFIERNPSDFHAVLADHEETAFTRQMATVGGYIDNAIQYSCSNALEYMT